MLLRLDHVNVRTANLATLVRFYTDVLGLHDGARPPLGFPGAWLYAGDVPVLHLVEVGKQPQPEGELRLEHFAFTATGHAAFVARLQARGVEYRQTRQAGTGNVVVNLRDPDGNRLHVDFPASEAS